MAAKKPAKSRKKTPAVRASAAQDVAGVVEAPPRGGLDLGTRVAADRARNEDGVRCDPGGDWCDPEDRASRIRPRIVSSASDEAQEKLAELKRKALAANPGPGGVPSHFPKRLPVEARREIDRDFAVSLLRGGGLGLLWWGDDLHSFDLADKSTEETQAEFLAVLEWAPGQAWISAGILRMAKLIDRPETSDRSIADLIKKKAPSLLLVSKLSALAKRERMTPEEKALELAEAQLSATTSLLRRITALAEANPEGMGALLQRLNLGVAAAADPSTDQPKTQPAAT